MIMSVFIAKSNIVKYKRGKNMDVKEILFKLSAAAGVGGLPDAPQTAADMLSKYASVSRDGAGNVIGKISGNSEYNIMLDAHIDEIGFMVTSVDENGFVTVTDSGGIDSRLLPAMEVIIHGKRKVYGVFCSTPPHLSKKDDAPRKLSEMHIDTGLGAEAAEIISVGDRVTYSTVPAALLNGCMTGKSFDNRAGVASLIRAAELLHEHGSLPCGVTILLSVEEELGCLGAGSAAYAIRPDEAVAVDVSYAKSPGTPPNKTGILGSGPMIGVSPTLCGEITERLKATAKENGIQYQIEAMGGKTSTNADVISISGSGIKTGLVSIPLRYMHTPVEVITESDVENTARLLYEYILKGGVKNA